MPTIARQCTTLAGMTRSNTPFGCRGRRGKSTVYRLRLNGSMQLVLIHPRAIGGATPWAPCWRTVRIAVGGRTPGHLCRWGRSSRIRLGYMTCTVALPSGLLIAGSRTIRARPQMLARATRKIARSGCCVAARSAPIARPSPLQRAATTIPRCATSPTVSVSRGI